MNQETIQERSYIEVSDPAVMALSPVVSVHMITYNHGRFLAEAIEGVIAQQTDFPIELVIGEDCSSDNTREISLDYQRRYPQLIRVIYSDLNVGMMVNVWRTLKACRGEFVAYCEGDDYWIDPEKLREQVAALSKFKNIDIVFHNCYLKYEKQNKKILSNVRSSTDKVFTLPEVICFTQYAMPTASLLVRRSLLMSFLDWFDSTTLPIGDYFIRVLGSKNGGAYYVNKPMSIYRIETQGSWTEKTINRMDALIEFQRKFLLALRKLQQVCPGQELAFKYFIIYHYSCLLNSQKEDNLALIRELMLYILKDIYDEPKPIVENSIADEQLESEYLLKFAVDSGNARDMADWKWEVSISWQFLRVARSLVDYGISILNIINNNRGYSNEYERKIAHWKTEANRSFLVARWRRLCKLIYGTIV